MSGGLGWEYRWLWWSIRATVKEKKKSKLQNKDVYEKKSRKFTRISRQIMKKSPTFYKNRLFKVWEKLIILQD